MKACGKAPANSPWHGTNLATLYSKTVSILQVIHRSISNTRIRSQRSLEMLEQTTQELMSNLHWTSLSPKEKHLATMTLRDSLLTSLKSSTESEAKRTTELLAQLEFQRLKETQSLTRLSDSSLMERARHFSLAVMH